MNDFDYESIMMYNVMIILRMVDQLYLQEISVDLGKSTYRYQKNKKGEDSYIEKGYCIMN